MTTLVLIAALGCGLNAGVFFAFSSFIMPALRRLAPERGLAAMQSINVVAVTPAFMTALFGTAALCLGLVVWAGLSWDEPEAPYAVAAGALYLVGTIGVTIAANVPRNDALAKLDADAPGSAAPWAAYLSEWTAWNHVRTIAALAAAALLAVGMTA
jgi:uncharacterized membrane protein